MSLLVESHENPTDSGFHDTRLPPTSRRPEAHNPTEGPIELDPINLLTTWQTVRLALITFVVRLRFPFRGRHLLTPNLHYPRTGSEDTVAFAHAGPVSNQNRLVVNRLFP